MVASAPRVLFLDHTSALGGGELFLATLAGAYRGRCKVLLFSDGALRQRLEADQVEVEVIAADAAMTGVARDGGVAAQLRAFPGVWSVARKVARQAASYDVIFANSQKALVAGAMAAWLVKKPLVWYLHDIVTADHFSAANRRVCVFLGNRFARCVIANSVATKDAFVAAGGNPAVSSVVYNGLDAAAFARPPNFDPLRLRAQLGLTQGPVVALFSRLAPWKGQAVLLEALTRLPGLQALLVGAPLFGDEILFEQELRAQAGHESLSGRVHFLGFREDIAALLHLTDIVVHTSIAPEPFGRVIVEGMLAGKPVVATRAGGACEIIEDEVTGRLVKPGDASELTSVLQDLLANPARAAALAAAGQEDARVRFSVEQMVSAISSVIVNALKTA